MLRRTRASEKQLALLAHSGENFATAVGELPMPDQERPSSLLPRVCALLAVAVLINYIDRSNLSIAAPLSKDELRLSASQLGILLSSFFWTYTLFQIVSGWAVDRFDVNWVIAAGFFAWSLATATTALIHGFAVLLVVRLVLGIGESVAFPSCSKILARHCAECRRGLANAVIIGGMMLGPALGTFAGGMLMARFGWRPFKTAEDTYEAVVNWIFRGAGCSAYDLYRARRKLP